MRNNKGKKRCLAILKTIKFTTNHKVLTIQDFEYHWITFSKKSKAVITILGTAGTRYNSELKVYKKVDIPAKYILENKELEYFNTFPLLIDKYSKDDKYELIALWTKEAKQAQEDVLEFYSDIDYTFLDKYKIDDPNEDKKFFELINSVINDDYDEIIFDVSHGFRHLPLLAIIGLIIENIENPKKISKILFAQEIIPFKKYKFIDLKGYLDISNIALILRTFLSTFKVPDLKIDMPLYILLKDFSTHLTSNQFKDIFDSDIPKLKEQLKKEEGNLTFVKSLVNELEILLNNIADIKNKNEYKKFIFFSKLFLNKEYFLHSSTYLIEGITYYLGEVFDSKKYIEFDTKEYSKQNKIVNFLKLNYTSKDFNFPNDYFVDINIETINRLSTLRDSIADIRHNLAHINISKEYGEIKEELKEYLQEFENIIKSKEWYNLNSMDTDKVYTVKYKLEDLQNQIKNLSKIPNASLPKLENLLKRYDENTLDKLTNLDINKTKKFMESNEKSIRELLENRKERNLFLKP